MHFTPCHTLCALDTWKPSWPYSVMNASVCAAFLLHLTPCTGVQQTQGDLTSEVTHYPL